MPKMWTPQATFGSGELSPSMRKRFDTKQYKDGAAQMRNVRLLNTGGFSRRPGTRLLNTLQTGARLVEFTFNVDQEYLLAFSAGRMDAFLWDADANTATAAGSLTSCPWSAADVESMTWVQSGDTVFLACRSWHPQVIQRTGASSWSREAWTADGGSGDSLKQPYYKFAAPDSTIAPSSRSGSITVTASSSVFTAAHVGQRIRYVGQEINVTGYTSGTQISGTVLQGLPLTFTITVGNTLGYLRYDVVEGADTGAKGEIVEVVNGTTLTVLMTSKGAFFTVGEKLDAPNASSEISATVETTAAAARDWDEPYMSPVYGYPGAVGLHRDRLWFSGHTQLPASILASAVGAYYNFDLGSAEDAEAIFEQIGDAAVAWVRHLTSAETLLLMTDQGAYYVPESPANPIRPSSIQFARVGAHGAGGARPQAFDEGVLYTHRSGNAVMDMRATGDTVKQWAADDVGLLASHLIRNPVDMAATHGKDGAPERYAFVVNDDGSMAVLHSIQSQQVLGWTLWTTDGLFKSVACLGGTVFVAVERTINSTTATHLEAFDTALTLDCVVEMDDEFDTVPTYAGASMWLRAGTESWGPISVATTTGLLAEVLDHDGALEAGLNFTPLVRTLTPEPQTQDGRSSGNVKRITKARVYIHEGTRAVVGNVPMTAHNGSEDVTIAPVARTVWHEVNLLGREREPSVTITQVDPVPLTVLGMSMEVVL
jgi:hypothetical protein